jgi:membrane-anchored protein YejM (alkaline phosphatase superfamily)
MLHCRLFGKMILALGLGLPLLLAAPRIKAQEGPFAHMAAAIYEMREAKLELKDERFKRHREQAIKDLDVAIEETEKAFREAKIELRRYEGPRNPKEYYKAYRDFPHLRHAIVELAEAKKEIEREKRGNFSRAVKAIDVAIGRVEEALKDAR